MTGPRRISSLAMVGLLALLFSACAESAHQTGLAQLEDRISVDARRLVDESITFADVKTDPARYTGQTVMFGGKVVQARLVPNNTEIEVLQLPLGADGIPATDTIESDGRFLAENAAFLDPATVPPDTAVTIIGTVEGEETRTLPGEPDPYTYPVLRIVQILNWPTLPQTNAVAPWPYQVNPYSRFGPSYWGPAAYGPPYWSPWGGGLGYYSQPLYSNGPGFRGHVPSHSPSSVPPQFRGAGPASGSTPSSFSGSSPRGGGRSIPPQFQKRLPH